VGIGEADSILATFTARGLALGGTGRGKRRGKVIKREGVRGSREKWSEGDRWTDGWIERGKEGSRAAEINEMR
jgi:hypothetical protein